MRTIRISKTYLGETIVLFLAGKKVAGVKTEVSLHRPSTDWQVFLSYMADWIEDGELPGDIAI